MSLQPNSQVACRKFDQLPKRQLQSAKPIAALSSASQPVWPVQFDNMGAERKKATLPSVSQPVWSRRRQPDLREMQPLLKVFIVFKSNPQLFGVK